MFVIDAMKETIVVIALTLFAMTVASTMTAWSNLPEYVWHLKAR